MERKFSKDHEWIDVDGDIATIGISDYAQKQLGDIVYVSLIKEVGEAVEKDEETAEVESVKSVSQIYSPLTGEIAEFNEIFEDESMSGIVNEDPYGKGWIFKVKLSDPAELDGLMSEKDYNDYVAGL